MRCGQALLTDLDHLRLREWIHSVRWMDDRRSGGIDVLRQKVCQSGVVGQREIPRDVVTMNSLVRLRDVSIDERITCTLSYPHDADQMQQKVSVAGPMGTELLGSRVGDTIDCPIPSGVRRLRIDKVVYQPEAAGDYHL